MYLKWGFCILLLWNTTGCNKAKSTKSIGLSTISSTDTLVAGTPKGMHLYLQNNGAINLNDLLLEKGYNLENLEAVRVDEIRIKVEIPEDNFNPNSIEGFNTSFKMHGNENTVIESDELQYNERTYIIKVNNDLSTISEIGKVFDLSGGLRLREKLNQNIVLTTSVHLHAKVRE